MTTIAAVILLVWLCSWYVRAVLARRRAIRALDPVQAWCRAKRGYRRDDRYLANL